MFSSMPAAGMLGSAMGAGAPTVVANSGVRGRLTPLKDLKNKQSPEQLKRLVAQISEKPESVQHHTVDQDGLTVCSNNWRRNPASTRCICPKASKAKVVPSDSCELVGFAARRSQDLASRKRRVSYENATCGTRRLHRRSAWPRRRTLIRATSAGDDARSCCSATVGIKYSNPAAPSLLAKRCAAA